MVYLTAEQVLFIHSMVIDESGGSHGIRDHHALAALVALPKQKAFGRELYPTIFDKAAVYARSIIGSHPFIDGNKRAAMTAASVFLENNGYQITAKEGEIEKFALGVIREKLSIPAIAVWFKRHSRKIRKR